MTYLLPLPGQKWVHKKSGKQYQVLTVTNIKSTREDFPTTVVYTNQDDIWSRPLTAWLEKMEYLHESF